MTSFRLGRRSLAASALVLGALGLTGWRLLKEPDDPFLKTRFPEGFRWGTATSAYQIEGATDVDGRGPSIWDTFTKLPGKIRNGATADIADDHYHLYKEDVALMKALGAKTYRFSIAWPRIFPEGRGTPNLKGLAFYQRLIDELLANGIEPYATLYHWDLPQALQDRGGWESRDTAQAFADYAGYVARQIGDRVGHFFTLNEMRTFVELGYGNGVFAPGLNVPRAQLYQVRHHAVLGHGLGVQAVRANGRAGLKVGPAENMTTALPDVETKRNVRAALDATRELNAPYLTVILEGRYTDQYLKDAGADAPRFTEADLKTISTPVDFVGINVYGPGAFVRARDKVPGYAQLPIPASYPHMKSSWLDFAPETLYWAPRQVQMLWNVKEIYITENGTSSTDKPEPDGRIDDLDRIEFLRQYLAQLRRATSEGVPVRGYFVWSLLDNFEWADGYGTRFGLHYVDYRTLKRTPKLSTSFYKKVIERNALV
ncbi:beta-glucosidase [Rhodospirillales bacterium URHD0017]|nr:beta-glucosidase [Rhodospirillales bacterium URHD0017]